MMMRAASSCCRRPCMLRAVLRGVTLCAGVAARATVRSVERFARRLAVGSVTGGITLSDILLYITMTEEDLSPDPEPTATYYDKLPTKRALAAGDVQASGGRRRTVKLPHV